MTDHIFYATPRVRTVGDHPRTIGNTRTNAHQPLDVSLITLDMSELTLLKAALFGPGNLANG